jgi:hypothetical protein
MATHEYRWRHLALLICILLVFVFTPFAVTFRRAYAKFGLIRPYADGGNDFATRRKSSIRISISRKVVR